MSAKLDMSVLALSRASWSRSGTYIFANASGLSKLTVGANSSSPSLPSSTTVSSGSQCRVP
eukprot:836369-Karenia_brevis.AAC.1